VKLGNRELVEKLTRSAIYRDYAGAFSAATGLPITLRGIEHWQPALRGAANENPFCALMAQSNRVCAACLEVQGKLIAKAGSRAHTVTCFAGLSDSAVPIRVGDQVIGFLQTGQVLLKQPKKFHFDRVAKKHRQEQKCSSAVSIAAYDGWQDREDLARERLEARRSDRRNQAAWGLRAF
jgi:ligand-binding sensor protein